MKLVRYNIQLKGVEDHMKPQEIQLTLIDKLILQSYRSMVEGLGNYLGSAYEIVLHSLEDSRV